ncbi:MAG: hypothetical protein Fur0022_00500 [Anaerolineales bacterium]
MEEPILEPVLEPGQGELAPKEPLPPHAGEGDAPPIASPVRTAPALTIHVQSWATPIIGFLMLVTGLLAGYSARPIMDPPRIPVTEVPASESSSSASAEQPAPEEQAARQQQLMEMILSQTRHFKGDENASVTLVEFSDFQ